MKTAILLCTKDTNNYLCEYVEYYRKLNFSNIILVDNSKEDNVYDILDKDDDFIIQVGKNNPDYYYTKSKVDPLYLQAEGHAVITQWYQMKNRIVEIIS